MRNLLLAATALALTAAAPATTPAAPHSRIFHLLCRATVPAAGTKTLELWMPVPHTDKSQDIQDLKIEASAPYTLATDQYGNQMLHIKPAAVPTAPLTVTLTALVTRREHLNLRATDDHAPAETEARDPNLSRWLAPDRLVPLDFKIKAQAQEVVDKAGAKTDLQKARAIYEHVVST
ncbi:MAG: transglutaminase domain-containing protein, partial [Hymenobacter sp.]